MLWLNSIMIDYGSVAMLDQYGISFTNTMIGPLPAIALSSNFELEEGITIGIAKDYFKEYGL